MFVVRLHFESNSSELIENHIHAFLFLEKCFMWHERKEWMLQLCSFNLNLKFEEVLLLYLLEVPNSSTRSPFKTFLFTLKDLHVH